MTHGFTPKPYIQLSSYHRGDLKNSCNSMPVKQICSSISVTGTLIITLLRPQSVDCHSCLNLSGSFPQRPTINICHSNFLMPWILSISLQHCLWNSVCPTMNSNHSPKSSSRLLLRRLLPSSHASSNPLYVCMFLHRQPQICFADFLLSLLNHFYCFFPGLWISVYSLENDLSCVLVINLPP